MKTEIKKSVIFPQKTFLGTVDNESIYLTAPSWDCGWYWGFGYLGNRNSHYHVDGLMDDKTNLDDGFKKHFGDSFLIKESDIWVFAELFKTFYILKETAELFGRGATYTGNPIRDIILNTSEVERINTIVLPAIFSEIYKVIERNKDNKKNFAKLVSLNLEGDTKKVIEFMKEKGIKTDDLKSIKELNSYDFSNIHSYYWKALHANKK